MPAFPLSPPQVRVLVSSTHDMQFICSDGNIVPAWKSLLCVFSNAFAQLLDSTQPGDEIVSLSVHETSDTILEILKAVKDGQKMYDRKVLKASYDISIPLHKDNSDILEDEVGFDNIMIDTDDKEIIKTAKTEIITDTENETLIVKSDTQSTHRKMEINRKKGRPKKERKSSLFCDQCKFNEGFRTKKAHKRHMLKFHQFAVHCEICSQSFSNYEHFQEHIKTHVIECGDCSKKYNSSRKLKIRSGKSPCPHCGIFVKNVNMHIYNQHTERELKTCPVCDYTQTSISRVNKHYRRMHTEMNVTNCGFCGILTKDLNYHLRMAQCDKKKDEKIMYQCDDCEKKFTLEASLAKHKKGIHEKIKDKICPQCSSCNLKLHVNRVHLGKKLQKETCEYCDKEFSNIEYHMKLYHAEKYAKP